MTGRARSCMRAARGAAGSACRNIRNSVLRAVGRRPYGKCASRRRGRETEFPRPSDLGRNRGSSLERKDRSRALGGAPVAARSKEFSIAAWNLSIQRSGGRIRGRGAAARDVGTRGPPVRAGADAGSRGRGRCTERGDPGENLPRLVPSGRLHVARSREQPSQRGSVRRSPSSAGDQRDTDPGDAPQRTFPSSRANGSPARSNSSTTSSFRPSCSTGPGTYSVSCGPADQ